MKKSMILALALAFSSSTLLTACDAGDFFAGLIGVGVGVGLSEAYHHHRHHRHHGRYYDVADNNGLTDLNSLPAQKDLAAVFASKHHIPLASAQKLQAAFAGLPRQGLASFQRVGLNNQDLRAIARRTLPSGASLDRMGQALNLSAAQSRDLLMSMTQEFDTQAADVESGYWQSCMDKGTWKTPENSYCEATDWKGCSPATGATLCY